MADVPGWGSTPHADETEANTQKNQGMVVPSEGKPAEDLRIMLLPMTTSSDDRNSDVSQAGPLNNNMSLTGSSPMGPEGDAVIVSDG